MAIDPNSPPPEHTWPIVRDMLRGDAFSDLPHCIDWLEAQGCDIDRQPGHLPLLRATSPSIWADYLRWALRDDPPIVQVFQQTASTQDAARRLVDGEGDRAHRAVVVAIEQTAGRGRLGRKWQAPPGAGLTFSMVYLYNPNHRQATLDRMVAATAVGCADGLEVAVTDRYLDVEIKWPNDLIADGRKLGGILVETHPIDANRSAAIIGVGINISLDPQTFRDTAPELVDHVTSLADLGYPHVDHLAVLTEVVKGMREALDHTPQSKLVGAWRRRNAMLHATIHFRSEGRDIRGSVVDIDLQQGLIVRTDTGALLHLPAATTTVVKWFHGK